MAIDEKITVIPRGSVPDDPFNQVATYYLIQDDGALPTEMSPAMREVLSRSTTPLWILECMERIYAKNKLKMRMRELRAKLTPEEWVELEEIEQKLNKIKK